VLAGLDVRERARPLLARLVADTGETATLSLPGDGEAITVDFIPGASSVVSLARLGRSSVGHATAAGKVVLAFSAGAQGTADERPLAAYTPRTITDRDVLAAQLQAIREQGVAEAVGEREPDLAALAAPVLGRSGELIAILGLQGPATRLPAATRKALRAPLLAAAGELGRALGAPGSAGQLQG
jgi:IclR family acetate operon transcriptional repressor